jgi:hypothetical protein
MSSAAKLAGRVEMSGAREVIGIAEAERHCETIGKELSA